MNTYSDKNRHPCGAVREGDWVVIAIHKNTIKNATELNQGLEYYSDEQEDYMPPKIAKSMAENKVDEVLEKNEIFATLVEEVRNS